MTVNLNIDISQYPHHIRCGLHEFILSKIMKIKQYDNPVYKTPAGINYQQQVDIIYCHLNTVDQHNFNRIDIHGLDDDYYDFILNETDFFWSNFRNFEKKLRFCKSISAKKFNDSIDMLNRSQELIIPSYLSTVNFKNKYHYISILINFRNNVFSDLNFDKLIKVGSKLNEGTLSYRNNFLLNTFNTIISLSERFDFYHFIFDDNFIEFETILNFISNTNEDIKKYSNDNNKIKESYNTYGFIIEKLLENEYQCLVDSFGELNEGMVVKTCPSIEKDVIEFYKFLNEVKDKMKYLKDLNTTNNVINR